MTPTDRTATAQLADSAFGRSIKFEAVTVRADEHFVRAFVPEGSRDTGRAAVMESPLRVVA